MAAESSHSNIGGNLKVLTWNIWFDLLMREQRMAALIEYILSEQPDVVCLQEVVPSVKRFLLQTNAGLARKILDGTNKDEDYQDQSPLLKVKPSKGPKFSKRLCCCSDNSNRASDDEVQNVNKANEFDCKLENNINANVIEKTKLSDFYTFSDNELGGYGLLTLVKKKVCNRDHHSINISRVQFDYKPFSQSTMGRGLLEAILDIEIYRGSKFEKLENEENQKTGDIENAQYGNVAIVVATSHLESLSNQKIRETQIKETAERLKNFPRAVFCGDFNFDATKTYGDWVIRRPEHLENIVLQKHLPDFVDTWVSLNHRPMDVSKILANTVIFVQT